MAIESRAVEKYVTRCLRFRDIRATPAVFTGVVRGTEKMEELAAEVINGLMYNSFGDLSKMRERNGTDDVCGGFQNSWRWGDGRDGRDYTMQKIVVDEDRNIAGFCMNNIFQLTGESYEHVAIFGIRMEENSLRGRLLGDVWNCPQGSSYISLVITKLEDGVLHHGAEGVLLGGNYKKCGSFDLKTL